MKIGCNNKVLGMMKDETAGTEITEFARLGAKCCALRVVRNAGELKKVGIDGESCTKTSSYIRSIYDATFASKQERSSLISNVTRTINSIIRRFEMDIRSGVVSEETMKEKGVKKTVVARGIMLENYKEVLFTGNAPNRKMNVIGSDLHNIYTITIISIPINKLA